MISSSRSTLYRFLSLYAALYAGFGVQSPYLPILLDTRHLSPETIALALAAGTAMRLTAAPAVARLADRFDAPRLILALCAAAAGLIGLGYLPAEWAWALIALGVVHTAALAPLPLLSDTLALGAAAPTGSGGMPKRKFHYGWLRGCGSAAFVAGLVVSGQAIGYFGIAVIVWLNAALLLAASPVALRVPQLLASSGHSRATRSQARGVLALLRLPLYRKMVLLAALILGSHAMHDSFAMIRWSRAGISPGTSGILWSLSVAAEIVVFVVVGRPLLDRIGPAGAAALSAGAGVVRWAVMAETAWLPALALIEPLHGLTFALLHLTCMRLLAQCVPKTPRGDGARHLRYRRHRCCDRSPYAWLRADFRPLWGTRVLGNGGSLCRGVAARPNSARAHRRSRVIVSLGWLPAALLVGPAALRAAARDQPAAHWT